MKQCAALSLCLGGAVFLLYVYVLFGAKDPSKLVITLPLGCILFIIVGGVFLLRNGSNSVYYSVVLYWRDSVDQYTTISTRYGSIYVGQIVIIVD